MEYFDNITSVGKRSRGRPSKLTDETVKKLMEAIIDGNTYEAACNYAGISYSVFADWVRKGEEYTKMLEGGQKGIRWEFINFLKELNRAKAEAEVNLVKKIKEAGDKDWRANAFLLERRNPEQWAKKVFLNEESNREIKIIFEDEDADNNEEEDDSGDRDKDEEDT